MRSARASGFPMEYGERIKTACINELLAEMLAELFTEFSKILLTIQYYINIIFVSVSIRGAYQQQKPNINRQ